jgi:hypothetical protein
VTASDTFRVVPAHEVDAIVANIPSFNMHRCAAIAFGPQGEPRPRNVATITVVEMLGAVFLVTAKHVVESGPAKEFSWRLLVPQRDSSGRMPPNAVVPPLVFPLKPLDVLWTSQRNDAAILGAPEGMRIGRFDGEKGVEASKVARETWDVTADQDAYGMVVVTGFPIFARIEQPDHMHYSLMSLPGFVVHGHRPTDAIDAPTLSLNLGCTTIREEFRNEPIAAEFGAQLHADEGGRGLAGMSGGPVTGVTDHGFRLIGILSQGSKALETGIAVPWDVIYTEFAESLVLGHR